jgi:hypothetical protein
MVLADPFREDRAGALMRPPQQVTNLFFQDIRGCRLGRPGVPALSSRFLHGHLRIAMRYIIATAAADLRTTSCREEKSP